MTPDDLHHTRVGNNQHCTCRIVLTTSANCRTKSSNTARCTRKRSLPAQFCPQLWKHALSAVGMTCQDEPISADVYIIIHALHVLQVLMRRTIKGHRFFQIQCGG